MLVYTAATLLTVLLVYFSQARNDRGDTTRLRKKPTSRELWKEKALYVLSAFPLFIISALRGLVGTDTWLTYSPDYMSLKWVLTGSSSIEEQNFLRLSYCRYFEELYFNNNPVINMNTFSDPEKSLINFFNNFRHSSIGFKAIQHLLVSLNADVQWVYVVTSFIIIFFVFLAIYRQSDHRVMAVLLFVLTNNYFLSLNIVRQFIAMAICLVACEFAEKRKPIPFFLLVCLSATFHVTSIVFLPVYFIPHLKIKPKWCFISIAACLILAPVITPAVIWFITTVLPEYFSGYIGKEYMEFEWIFFAIDLAVLVVSSYYYKQLADRPYFKLWYYANVLALLALCFTPYLPEIKRISFYFSTPHFLLLPMLPDGEENVKRRKLLKAAIILMFLAETIVAVGLMNKNGVLPYKPFWQEDYNSVLPYFDGAELISGTDMLP